MDEEEDEEDEEDEDPKEDEDEDSDCIEALFSSFPPPLRPRPSRPSLSLPPSRSLSLPPLLSVRLSRGERDRRRLREDPRSLPLPDGEREKERERRLRSRSRPLSFLLLPRERSFLRSPPRTRGSLSERRLLDWEDTDEEEEDRTSLGALPSFAGGDPAGGSGDEDGLACGVGVWGSFGTAGVGGARYTSSFLALSASSRGW